MTQGEEEPGHLTRENRGVECDPEAQKCRKVEKQRGRKVKSMKSKKMSEEGTGVNQILICSL